MKWIKVLHLCACVITAAGILPAFAENTPPSLAKNTVTLARDTAITTYIYAKLATLPDLAHENIDISTNEGKVTLNGIVTTAAEVKEIVQAAESTSGVKSVDASNIIVTQQATPVVNQALVPEATSAQEIQLTARTAPPAAVSSLLPEKHEAPQHLTAPSRSPKSSHSLHSPAHKLVKHKKQQQKALHHIHRLSAHLKKHHRHVHRHIHKHPHTKFAKRTHHPHQARV